MAGTVGGGYDYLGPWRGERVAVEFADRPQPVDSGALALLVGPVDGRTCDASAARRAFANLISCCDPQVWQAWMLALAIPLADSSCLDPTVPDVFEPHGSEAPRILVLDRLRPESYGGAEEYAAPLRRGRIQVPYGHVRSHYVCARRGAGAYARTVWHRHYLD